MDVAIIRTGFIWLIIGGSSQLALALSRPQSSDHNSSRETRLRLGFRASVGFGQVMYGFCGLNLIYQTPFHVPGGFRFLTAVASLCWLLIDPVFLRTLKGDITTVAFGITTIVFALFLCGSELAAL
jgi:hypothetical protein